MDLTLYPQVNVLIQTLASRIQSTLNENLIGLYLYGSATAGDFDLTISDIDLLTVIDSHLSKGIFDQIQTLHDQVAIDFPDWKDRIEVVYITKQDLANCKRGKVEVAEISPGEPFHSKEIGEDWLISWYVIRESGVTIYGPEIQSLVPEILLEEYKEAIKKKTLLWQEYIDEITPQNSRGSMAYAVFTLCRALYSYTNGHQASKKKSAEWIATTYPEWQQLVSTITEWRKNQWIDNKEIGTDLPKILDFLKFAIEKII